MFDVIEDAGAKESAFVVFGADVQLAGAKTVDLLQYTHHCPQILDISKRAKHPIFAVLGVARDIHTGKFLPGG